MFGFGVSDLHLLMHRLRIVCISRTAFQALASHLCGPKIYPWIEILGNFWSFCIFNFWTWQVIRTNQRKLHLQNRRVNKNNCCEVRLRFPQESLEAGEAQVSERASERASEMSADRATWKTIRLGRFPLFYTLQKGLWKVFLLKSLSCHLDITCGMLYAWLFAYFCCQTVRI